MLPKLLPSSGSVAICALVLSSCTSPSAVAVVEAPVEIGRAPLVAKKSTVAPGKESALASYHAKVSKMVQDEWQLNCQRNRDSIKPGKIVVRFGLAPSGKVHSLNILEASGVTDLQKRFTEESIRSAAIPPFSEDLKKQLKDEPLEITYSFTF